MTINVFPSVGVFALMLYVALGALCGFIACWALLGAVTGDLRDYADSLARSGGSPSGLEQPRLQSDLAALQFSVDALLRREGISPESLKAGREYLDGRKSGSAAP
jgi:hypothetical protein